ncbi:MAG: arsenate reductase ArsC, partial [Candidatus Marinimicrobia bacterium]|nr:arsenate reductase ArsC [Candidatus Neomarinimicrobiota bacterium]
MAMFRKMSVNLGVETTQKKPTILFICTGNSVRSQVAEGLMRNKYGELFEVFSAGVSPSSVHPKSVETLREIGINISHHESKSVHDLPISEFDVIITLCDWARSLCLNLKGKRQTIHW